MAKHRHQRGAPAVYPLVSTSVAKKRRGLSAGSADRMARQAPGTDEAVWVPLQFDGETRESRTGRMIRLFSNNLYAVMAELIAEEEAENEYRWNAPIGWVHISIHRKDGDVIIPFHHRQHIKNQVLGSECEAVEVYPAHSEMVDVGDMFHLWGCPNPDYRLPYGFGNPRSVHPDRDFAPDEYIGGVWPPPRAMRH